MTGGEGMKIVILQGSPNRRGSTYLLADSFRQGAESAGHTVEIVDAARADVRPCTGCVHCGYEGPCAQKDGMEDLRRKILDADMLVFATPLYYYGMTAQLKAVVDRFCAFNSSLTRRRRSAGRKGSRSCISPRAWRASEIILSPTAR